ncbi:MAG: response regulator [Bacteroidota bacterium]
MNKKNQINIFIVEDNKVFTQALKADIETAFMNMPLKINSFVTGETCMQKFKEEKPQVVILDYHLNSRYPDAADGIKVLDWIKKENYETNVIMLTGDDHIDIALKSFHHGASDYVVKTDSKFRKINFSLLNLFKMMEAKSNVRKYKRLAFVLFLAIAILVGGITAIQIFSSSLLK